MTELEALREQHRRVLIKAIKMAESNDAIIQLIENAQVDGISTFSIDMIKTDEAIKGVEASTIDFYNVLAAVSGCKHYTQDMQK